MKPALEYAPTEHDSSEISCEVPPEVQDTSRRAFIEPNIDQSEYVLVETPKSEISGRMYSKTNTARHVEKVPRARIEKLQTKPVLSESVALQRKQDRERYLDGVFNQFIESLGDLDELKQALAFSDSPKAHNFLVDLVNPANHGQTTTYLARRNGINASQLSDIWKNYNLSKSIQTMLGAAPQIAADVAMDSRSSRLSCPRCDGFGVLKTQPELDEDGREIPGTAIDCPQCEGKGYIRKSGDSDARKLLYESIGLVSKRGPSINVNVNAGSHSVESVLDDLEHIESRARIVDIPPVSE